MPLIRLRGVCAVAVAVMFAAGCGAHRTWLSRTETASAMLPGGFIGNQPLAHVGADGAMDGVSDSDARIVPVAMKITLGSGEEKTVALKTVTPRER